MPNRQRIKLFVGDCLWAWRYWRRFHREENLLSPPRFIWRYAVHVLPAGRRDDKVKYG